METFRCGNELTPALLFPVHFRPFVVVVVDETPAYGLQGSFGQTISALMHTYNTSPPADELKRAQTELNQVKDIMVQNVEQILSRGERIELLVDKTDVMAGQATAFRRGARNVRREMWWRNRKIVALSVIVALVSVTAPSLVRF
jgi:vesicle-associated membrane protein 7